MSLTLVSGDFRPGAGIPEIHTCDGANLSPSLSWSDVPPGTRSLALVVDDPDAPDPAAPTIRWVHWVLYNIPPQASQLATGIRESALQPGTEAGLNDWKNTHYGGPCPPTGRHRYIHTLYALDTVLPDLRHPTRLQLERAMQGHVLEQVSLVGTYQRGR
jgi:Raf kinase inhibitor-like YbhB/YbcL family protein